MNIELSTGQTLNVNGGDVKITDAGDVYAKGVGGYDGTNATDSNTKTLQDCVKALIVDATYSSNEFVVSDTSVICDAIAEGRVVYLKYYTTNTDEYNYAQVIHAGTGPLCFAAYYSNGTITFVRIID